MDPCSLRHGRRQRHCMRQGKADDASDDCVDQGVLEDSANDLALLTRYPRSRTGKRDIGGSNHLADASTHRVGGAQPLWDNSEFVPDPVTKAPRTPTSGENRGKIPPVIATNASATSFVIPLCTMIFAVASTEQMVTIVLTFEATVCPNTDAIFWGLAP